MDGEAVRTPRHVWIVGIVSLIWNSFGAWDYLQTQLEHRDYIAAMTEPMGVGLDEALVYYAAFPAWMDAAWALGVWGAVLGSVLLLLRNRFAVAAFLVSLFGLFVATLYGIAEPMPGMEQTVLTIGFTIVLWAVAIALIFYSRYLLKHNHLR